MSDSSIQTKMFEAAGMQWVACTSLVPLLSRHEIDWRNLSVSSGARLVKSGEGRQVWALTRDDTSIYAKVFDPPNTLGRIKSRLLGSPAYREWRAAQNALGCGVRIACPLGYAQCDDGGSVYTSEALLEAAPLPETWAQASKQPDRRRRITQAVAELIARAHDGGFHHRDAHPHNILVGRDVRPDAEGSLYAAFVDLLGARQFGTHLSNLHSAKGLAQIDQYAHRTASPRERLRFLRFYCGQRHDSESTISLREWLELISRQSERNRKALARRRDRRLRKGNGKYFARMVFAGGWRACACLTLERRHVFPERRTPDRTRGEWRSLLAEILDGGTPASSAGQDSGAGQPLQVEVRYVTGIWSRLVGTIRRTHHRRCFEECHRARHRDQYRPLALAYAERRRFGLVNKTVLIRPSDNCGSIQDDTVTVQMNQSAHGSL